MSSSKFKTIEKDSEIGRIVHNELGDQFSKTYVLFGDDETCLPGNHPKFAEAIQKFEIRNSDVIVSSYPKAGTTWVQEMVWLICNHLDFKAAENLLIARFPFLEICTFNDYDKMDQFTGQKTPEMLRNSIEFIKKLENPRFIKTHLPFSLLPDDIRNQTKTPKIIYVMRNPKDLCVSYYHHGRLLQRWTVGLENFCKVFLADRAQYGSYWKHIFGYWNHRSLKNLLIIKYEDMKKDLPAVIRQVAGFLDKPLTNEQVVLLADHLSFESMKKNKALNAEGLVEMRKKHGLVVEDGAFIRSGTVGKYKEEMSPETIKKFDDWIKQNIKGTSFEQEYDYDL